MHYLTCKHLLSNLCFIYWLRLLKHPFQLMVYGPSVNFFLCYALLFFIKFVITLKYSNFLPLKLIQIHLSVLKFYCSMYLILQPFFNHKNNRSKIFLFKKLKMYIVWSCLSKTLKSKFTYFHIGRCTHLQIGMTMWKTY